MPAGEKVESVFPNDLTLMVEASTGGFDFTESSESRLDELEKIRGQTHLIVQRILFPIVVCFGCLGNSVTIVVLTRYVRFHSCTHRIESSSFIEIRKTSELSQTQL